MPSLEGSIKVPVVGSVSKKSAAIYGGLAVGVVAIAVVRHRRAQSYADPAVDSTDGGDSSTGYTYGTSGDGGGYGDYTATPGTYNGSAFGTGYTGAGAADDTDTTTTTVKIGNNAQWSNDAVEKLSGQGLDSGVVLAALGPYLQGRAVTDAQRNIVEQAVAVSGQPPQAGVNGYPPSIRHTTTPVRAKLGTPAVASRSDSTKTYIQWRAIPNAKSYEVWSGTRLIAEISTTRGTLHRAKTADQKVFVVAKNTGGGYPNSAHSNVVTVPKLPAPKPKPKPKPKGKK